MEGRLGAFGPESSAATMDVLRRAERPVGLGLSFQSVQTGLAALQARGSTFPADVLETARRPTASCSGRCPTTSVRRLRRVALIPQASCASGSTSTPISVRPAPAAAFLRAAAIRPTSSSSARIRTRVLRRPGHVPWARRDHADPGPCLPGRRKPGAFVRRPSARADRPAR